MQFLKHSKNYTYYYFDEGETRTILMKRDYCSGIKAIIKIDLSEPSNLEAYNIHFPNGEYYLLDYIKSDLYNYNF